MSFCRVPRLVTEGCIKEDLVNILDLLDHVFASMNLCFIAEVTRVQVINIVPLHVKHYAAWAVVRVKQGDCRAA